jgi:hypothetical protein
MFVPKLPLEVIRRATEGEEPGIAGAVPGVPLEGPSGQGDVGVPMA